MPWFKCTILALALLQGGWLAFDGGRALLAGDYFTPSSGPGAGKLGPWSRIVSALGLEPRSTLIKCLHLFLGAAWLAAAALFALFPGAGWWAVLLCSICSLWYLPIGTVASLVVIVLLMTSKGAE